MRGLARRRHRAAQGHDLELVDVAADVLARRAAHLVRAVRDEPDHADAAVDRIGPFRAATLVAVPAGLRDVAARDEQPRADEVAFLQRHANVIDRFGFNDMRPQAARIRREIHGQSFAVELTGRFIASQITGPKAIASQ